MDDLGVLATALNVPLPLLLPVHVGHGRVTVALTPAGTTTAVDPWWLWEWMHGEQERPGRLADGEWQTSARILWLYQAVPDAQLRLDRLWRHRERDETAYVDGLQALVDAIRDMRAAGLETAG